MIVVRKVLPMTKHKTKAHAILIDIGSLLRVHLLVKKY